MPAGRARYSCVALLVLLAGCTTSPRNPSFDISATDARHALHQMRGSPRGLQRPVLVLDGLGPPMASWKLAGELKRLTGDDRVIGVTFVFTGSFEDCRRRVIDAVERRYPSSDPGETREVDVVAVSMGGVVARYAANPLPGAAGKRLRVTRLFTVSSPHRGAQMAALPALLGRKQLDMRQGSPFLGALARREAEGTAYELIPYARLGDVVVGARNAAPAGVTPLWLPNLPLEPAHLGSSNDPRIVADIARRLRGESPFATDPPQPLPKG